MEKAIKLAIEKGGYISPIKNADQKPVIPFTSAGRNLCLLDPLFWQALGRACGWGDTIHNKDYYGTYCTICRGLFFPGYNGLGKCWQQKALRFFETKLSGGDEGKFWSDLLNN